MVGQRLERPPAAAHAGHRFHVGLVHDPTHPQLERGRQLDRVEQQQEAGVLGAWHRGEGACDVGALDAAREPAQQLAALSDLDRHVRTVPRERPAGDWDAEPQLRVAHPRVLEVGVEAVAALRDLDLGDLHGGGADGRGGGCGHAASSSSLIAVRHRSLCSHWL